MGLKKINALISSSNSWQDLYDLLSKDKSLTDKVKGDIFERVTQAYLQTQPRYQSILKQVWLEKEIPQKIRKKLNLPMGDYGIDLVAETKKGGYWSIQSKYRSDQSKALTYKELSTFHTLSFTTAKNISLAIVSHTISKPIKNIALLPDLTELGIQTWLDLTKEEWDSIRNVCKNKPVKLKKRTPRPHQKKAIKNSVDHFINNKNSRGRMIMPCATGKSLTAFWIAQELKAKKIIVAVPSLSLVKASLNDWTKEYLANDIVPEWLCVCSDKTVGNVETDEFDTNIYDLGIPTTTDENTIRNFLNQRTKNPKIVFTTYQSSDKLAKAAKNIKQNFDLAILDEAHRTVGRQDKTFATLLKQENINIKKRLFMTATERVISSKNDEVFSMSDEKVYGKRFHELSFKEAIEKKIISDYKIVTINVTNAEIEHLIENNRLIEIKKSGLKDSEAASLAAGIALKKIFKKHKIKHAISFHRSIPLANEFRKQQDEFNNFKSLGPQIKNLHISSKKTTGERAVLMKSFIEHERSLLTNARCLTEGIDIPAIDCVLFADPKQSVVDIVQASGRALRKHDQKEFGYIVVPIVVPDDVNFDTYAEQTPFKKVASIVAALSIQDERIAEEFHLITAGKKSKGTIINIESGIALGKKLEIDQFSNVITTKIWEKVAKVNYQSFEDARKIVRSYSFKNREEFTEAKRKNILPLDIPSKPERVYKYNGWSSVGDWLGTGFIAYGLRKYKPFLEAREYVRKLGLKSTKEWQEFSLRSDFPEDLPKTPRYFYKNNGWIDMPDWLGSGYIPANKRSYRTFAETKKYIRNLGCKSQKDWIEHIKLNKLPTDIPYDIATVYKNNGWVNWGDTFGTDNFKRKYVPFKEARAYARSLNLSSGTEWRNHYRRNDLPSYIPKTPMRAYRDEWVSMGDWLGNGKIADQLKEWRPFKEARTYARSLNLSSGSEWYEHCKSGKKPDDIPNQPHGCKSYQDEWLGMSDWLGTQMEYLDYYAARDYVRNLKLKSIKEWKEFVKTNKKPANIPSAPYSYYKKTNEWINWGDWMGIDNNKGPKYVWRHFKDARDYARNLNLKTSEGWKAHSKSNKLPSDIPKHPNEVYKKTQEWTDWYDWLGTRKK